MTATGTRRGNLIYHWKHGWIPLDHFAALSKAHHSKTGAVKVMQKHGIDVPKGYRSDHKVTPEHSHPTGAWVRATQPGISHETHGKVVGHTDSGMLRVQYQDRLGKSQVGTFNPAHTTVVAQEAGKRHTSAGANFRAEQQKAAAAVAHPTPHTLKPGDHATVRGVDESGAPIHFTGEVRGTTAVTMSRGGKKTPMLGITVKRESPTTGAMRHDTVYVPDPNRDPAKIDAARKAASERDQLRKELNAKYAGKGAPYMQQRHGIDPAAMNTTDLAKYHKSLQAEHDMVLLSDGKKLRDAMAAEHTKRGTEARVRGLAPEGKFGGVHSETHMGEKITVRKGREWGTLRTEINGQHVGTPHGTKNSDAVKELDSLKATVAHAKANPGSYTNGAGEASYGMKLDPNAARATQLREAAAKKRAEADRIANSVGAPDRAGAMLRAKDSARMNARMDSGLRRYTEAQRQAKALESKAHLADGRAKSAAEKQAASGLALTASRVSPGDLIAHKGQAHMVTKVNRTTVSVPSIVGGPWEDKLPLGQVSKHVKVADMKESTLRTLMSRAKGNAALQAVYAAELKRRGLLT